MSRMAVTILPMALAAARTRAGFSQEGLAVKAQTVGRPISLSLVGMIEAGRRQPSIEVAEALAAACNVPLGEIAVPHDSDLARRIAVAVTKAAA